MWTAGWAVPYCSDWLSWGCNDLMIICCSAGQLQLTCPAASEHQMSQSMASAVTPAYNAPCPIKLKDHVVVLAADELWVVLPHLVHGFNTQTVIACRAMGVVVIMCGAQVGVNGAGPGPEISYLAWNRKVEHIIATCGPDGAVIIWDMRRQRRVMTLRDNAGCCPADLLDGQWKRV